MIKNYITVTLRNFLRNRNYTLINILGLSTGITSCIIIFLLIMYDLSFDKFHSRYERICRIVQDSENASGVDHNSSTPYPLIKAFRNDFPEIPLTTQVHYQDEGLVKIGAEKMLVENILFADSLFFSVFDFEVLSGNPAVELGQPGKVFLTKSLAEKLLQGKEQGTIRIGKDTDLEVAGIIADPPATSHIRFTMVVSMPSLTREYLGFPIDQWDMTIAGFTYLVLPDAMDAKSVEDRLPALTAKYHTPDDAKKRSFHLQALPDIHFDEVYTYNPGDASTAEASDLVGLGILGVFILLIACINFINLATALAVKKSKEIGIRKTLGARRRQLTSYFLGETFLLTIFALLISLCAAEWLLSWINNFLDKQLDLDLLGNPVLIVFLALLILFTTVLSGFYPAIILSAYDPVAVLKNKMAAQGSSGAAVRKVLVVFQFLIAQVLIIGTLIIADQMEYFRSKPLGFDKNAVINIPVPEIKKELMESLRTRLESNPNIETISFSLGAPTSDNNFGTNYFLTEKGRSEIYSIAVKPVDRHYLDTYGLQLTAGRWFTEAEEKTADPSLPGEDRKYVYIVNESAARKLGFSDPRQIIGQYITTGVSNINAEVVGVVRDFHSSSLHSEIEPVVLVNFPVFYYVVGLKLGTGNLPETIRFVEKNWSEVFPEYYFEYEFLDQQLADLYRQEERTFTLFKIFAGISIFIGCLGLYGLIAFMANQKLKEVGIRKVMGASVADIVVLFSKEFIRLIIIAFLIAAPLAWYLMNEWLQGFAYQIDIHWTVFLAGIVSTLVIALATVGYRSIRAAVSNPVETLRSE